MELTTKTKTHSTNIQIIMIRYVQRQLRFYQNMMLVRKRRFYQGNIPADLIDEAKKIHIYKLRLREQ
jgi:hypothetical protein